MSGIRTRGSANTSQRQVSIPDELKGIKLDMIVLPAQSESERKEFLIDADLKQSSMRDPDSSNM